MSPDPAARSFFIASSGEVWRWNRAALPEASAIFTGKMFGSTTHCARWGADGPVADGAACDQEQPFWRDRRRTGMLTGMAPSRCCRLCRVPALGVNVVVR